MKQDNDSFELSEIKKCKKAINFDLNTSQLKKIYNTNNPFVYLKAYREIGDFLRQESFSHRQWSGYISNDKLSDVDILNITYKLNIALPWFHQCVKKFDVTDIGEQHDLMYIFQKTERTKLQEKVSEQQNLIENSAEKSKGTISRESILKSAKIIAQKESYVPKKEHSKDNSL